MNALQGKVAYITGGSQGIGLGIAQSLLKQGMKVAISGRNSEKLEAAAEILKSEQGTFLTIPSDVRNLENENQAVRRIVDAWGQLDVLIANAGIGHYASIEEMTIDQWNQTIDTNLTGVFHSVKAALDSIKSSKGYIITIASLAGANFFANGTAYNASKFGLVGFTQALMLDLRHQDIKVSTIMPGSVATYFNGNIPDDSDAWKIQPEDVGQLVVDLLKMHPRTLPSKVEVRPSKPPLKK
ncbi:MAG TPA: SDR family oxidoreductase [Membranihabitans sp.]|nr:SDR family oxidoreductase [Membranihabitans sp.]